MKVIGIDQSFTSCGLAAIENGELIEAKKAVATKEYDRYDQAVQIAREILWFCDAHEPDAIGVEGLAFGIQRGDATRDLAGLLFTIINHLRVHQFRDLIEVISPKTVKVFACGKGRGNAKKPELYESLPQDVREYIDDTGVKKTTGRYDLTDAYWIARYREDMLNADLQS